MDRHDVPRGNLNDKHDRPPGRDVAWCGVRGLHKIIKMYRLFRQNESLIGGHPQGLAWKLTYLPIPCG